MAENHHYLCPCLQWFFRGYPICNGPVNRLEDFDGRLDNIQKLVASWDVLPQQLNYGVLEGDYVTGRAVVCQQELGSSKSGAVCRQSNF